MHYLKIVGLRLKVFGPYRKRSDAVWTTMSSIRGLNAFINDVAHPVKARGSRTKEEL